MTFLGNPIWISLGKCGDIVASIPILYRHYQAHKEKPKVVVARQYLSVLDRVPFVEPVAYNGSWQDLDGALTFAKRMSGEVVCLSMYGKDFPMEHKCSSFQLDAYHRAGCLKLWDSLPFGAVVRGKIVPFERPTILYADHAESAPFLHKEELFELLKENFPQHQIIRLSMHRLPHIFDFLEWYAAADALVTVDTAHLHLSAAIKGLPVVALSAEKPSRWKGSCWSQRFSFFCRYGEFVFRKDELVDCLWAAINKESRMEVVEI